MDFWDVAVVCPKWTPVEVADRAGERWILATNDDEQEIIRRLLYDRRMEHVWGELLATELVGIAEVTNRHAELYVDRSGRCFCYSNVDDGFRFEGSSFGEAIERLLLGRCSRPMLRPEQRTVWHYGEEISADDPRVYKYR